MRIGKGYVFVGFEPRFGIYRSWIVVELLGEKTGISLHMRLRVMANALGELGNKAD